MSDDITQLDNRIRDLERTVSGGLAELMALVQSESVRCPYREQIAFATNNSNRLKVIEQQVTDLRISWAKSGAAGGGVVGAITTAVFLAGKAAGWW